MRKMIGSNWLAPFAGFPGLTLRQAFRLTTGTLASIVDPPDVIRGNKRGGPKAASLYR